MEQEAKQPFKSIQIDAVIIRADGTREDLGTIARTNFDENGNQVEETRTVKVETKLSKLVKRVMQTWQL